MGAHRPVPPNTHALLDSPHSGIIPATPGLKEYRQIHLAGANPGLSPATEGVETAIPADRKNDGIADYLAGQEIKNVSGLLAPIASAVHEYHVAATLT
jgi:hypothetical protein